MKSTQEIQQSLSQRFKQSRLDRKLTRQGLAQRSGVSASSLKRFETTGHISLQALLKLSLVLDCLNDFEDIATKKHETRSLDEILHEKPRPKRGSIT
jgi:transcriptional regulator with XRE-family HTH domain